MVGWFRIIFKSGGWDENKDIICKIIKPVVEKLEKTGDIVNFFFLQYPIPADQGPPMVKFWFYGNESNVTNEIKNYRQIDDKDIEKFDPASQKRFLEDYNLGIKIFEIGSRLALCRIDDKNPIDKSIPGPIILTMSHAFLQNLGYIGEEENSKSWFILPCLFHFSEQVKQIKIK